MGKISEINNQPTITIKEQQDVRFHTKMGKPKVKTQHITDQKLTSDGYAQMWHRRFGHISLPVLRKLLEQQGYKQILPSVSLPVCEVCALSEMTEKSYDQY